MAFRKAGKVRDDGGVAAERERAVVARSEVFHVLSTQQQIDIVTCGQRRQYAEGEWIESPEAGTASLGLVMEGMVQTSLIAPSGREVTLAQRGSGEIFGFPSARWSEPADLVVQALVDATVVVSLPIPTVLQLTGACPDVVGALIELLWGRIEERQNLVGELVFYDASSRLAHRLATLAERSEEHIVTQTHGELARMIGTTRQRVSTELASLRQEHVIAYESFDPFHRILVLDLDRLRTRG